MSAQGRQQGKRSCQAHGTLQKIAGDTGQRCSRRAQKAQSIEIIAKDHPPLCRKATKHTTQPEMAIGAAGQGGNERHKALDDQGAGDIMRIALEEIRQRRANTAGKSAIQRPKHPATQKDESISKIQIPLGRRHLNVDHHRRGAGQRRKEGRLGHFADLVGFHVDHLLRFGLKWIILKFGLMKSTRIIKFDKVSCDIMFAYTLKKEPGQSLYEALYAHIRDEILEGHLLEGERLPSKRALAAHLGVSVITVESAYAQLVAEGYVQARERSGFYVCSIGGALPIPPLPRPIVPEEPKKPPLLDLSRGGGEDVPFPFSVWVRTMRAVIGEKDKEILRPVDFRGAPELRQAIADHLYQTRGLRVSPENIVVGAGNEQLYGLLIQLLGRQRIFAVEDPGHRAISGIYRANDVALRPIPLDGEGLSVTALAASDANVVHISPAHHYPTGIVMPIRRRKALLDWAGARGYIIEDDYDSELRHSGRPLPPLFSLDGRERVLYLSTFSQTIAPSLRIAYVCLPPHLLTRLRDKLGFYTCAVPTFEQHTLARFIASGAYEKHVNRLRKRLRDKRTQLLADLAAGPMGGKCTVEEAAAGAHFLLCLKTNLPDETIRARCAALGLALRFLSDYQQCDPRPGCLIVNYTCLRPEDFRRAMALLAGVL